jgi:hypothetical protein
MCSGNLLWHGRGQEAAGPPLGFAAAATKWKPTPFFFFLLHIYPENTDG